jgi:hypothetical protein
MLCNIMVVTALENSAQSTHIISVIATSHKFKFSAYSTVIYLFIYCNDAKFLDSKHHLMNFGQQVK